MDSGHQQMSTGEEWHLPGVVLTERVKDCTAASVLSAVLKPGDRIVERSMTRLGGRRAPNRSYASRLQSILDKMMDAARRQDRDRLVQLDDRLHETILEISRSKTLHQLWKTLQVGTWSIVTHRKSTHDAAHLAVRHGNLLQAWKSGDPQGAAHPMQHCIEDMDKPPADMNTNINERK